MSASKVLCCCQLFQSSRRTERHLLQEGLYKTSRLQNPRPISAVCWSQVLASGDARGQHSTLKRTNHDEASALRQHTSPTSVALSQSQLDTLGPAKTPLSLDLFALADWH